MQVWFVGEHLVDAPLVHADGQAADRTKLRKQSREVENHG